MSFKNIRGSRKAMKALIVCLCIIYGLSSTYANYSEDSESGSGYDDNLTMMNKKDKQMSSFVKAQPIGPMETISVDIQGNASTTSNFNKVIGDSSEIVRPEKTNVLKFQESSVENNVDDSIKKHKVTEIKEVQKKKSNKKKNSKKKSAKKTKKSHFPKIILYQGPISKALENILTAKISTKRQLQNRVVTPMTFEEATADIKRSSITHPKTNNVPANRSQDKNTEEDNQVKKSKLHKKAPKKYVIKGYTDSLKADKKSYGTKKDKVKASFGTRNNEPNLNMPSNYNKDQKLTPVSAFPPFPQHPIVSSPFPDNFGVNILNLNNKQDKQKPDNVADQKHLNEEVKTTAVEMSNQKQSKAPIVANSGPADQELDEEGDDDDDGFISDKNNTVLPTASSLSLPKGSDIDFQTVPNNPLKNNQGTPEPVVNAPDSEMPVNQKNTKSDEEEDDQDVDEVDNLQLPASLPVVPSQPSSDINRELLDKVQANSRGIEALNGDLAETKSKVDALAVSISDIGNDLKRIEKKLNEKKAKESFVKFAGPLAPLQQQNPFFGSPRIIEIIKRPSFKLVKKPFFLNRPIPINIIQGSQLFSNQPPFPIFNKIKQRRPINLPLERRKPKVVKEIFLPLPPPDSPAAKDIEEGKPMPGLPWPINQIVTMMMRQLEKSTQEPVKIPKVQLHVTKPLRQPLPSPDIDYPPREHDIDQLEFELGRIPITRLGIKENQRPKIVFFPKEQNFVKPFDFIGKDCDEPCLNGGFCAGGNICKCPIHFDGPKCERGLHRSFTELVEIIPSEEDIAPKKSNLFTFPLGVSTNDNDEEKETVGQVDQKEIVDALSKFIDQIPALSEKRSSIPEKPQKFTEEEMQFLKRKK
ncbi:uncharacterized protein LOC101238528 isoform X11 [Hydra vulgaris]|uniref:Uncharacterized protein LOC101238528 isoform X11 n=1 Tax=Hydra vulgaris TaxID=6087 RepID=A0ABM4BD43_HYDVU